MADEEQDLSWKKPAWATDGPKLRATGKDVKSGNLAKPITNIREVVEKGEAPDFEKPEWTADVAGQQRSGQDLAKPTTAATQNASLAFEKPDWTKEKKLNATKKGEALAGGGDIARPIGGIKPVDED